MDSRRLTTVGAVAALLAAVLVLAACAPATLPTQPKGGTITGDWQLDKVNGAQAPAGPKPVTASFAAGQVSGFSGVNTYSGPYTAGQDGAFKAGPLRSTMMAGEPTAGQLETGYLKALESATSYYAADGKLTLYSLQGVAIVVYLQAK